MASVDSLRQVKKQIITCRVCPRLVEWREHIALVKRRAYRDWNYWGKPVPGFGDPQAQILIVGLAPGAHGSNRTGRQFTGDASGDFLYPALYRAGFANQPDSRHREDGMVLQEVFITSVCRCAPPGNKPTSAEVANCQHFLEQEIRLLQPRVVVALGRLAFDSLQRIFSTRANKKKGVQAEADQTTKLTFAHAAFYQLSGGVWLICSYHPSRQNTQTGRLSEQMFDKIWVCANRRLDG